MDRKVYEVSVGGELQPYFVRAKSVRDAILIVKGRLIERGYPDEIVRVSCEDEFGCTDAFNNISVSVRLEECL